ncbi:hypothetical protein [Methanosarcina sp. DH2]|nr:hypothetical protein [Methanosarcina sp. DH2]
MAKKIRLLVSLPFYLKEKLEKKSKEFGCSQAEVMRTAFIRMMEADK